MSGYGQHLTVLMGQAGITHTEAVLSEILKAEFQTNIKMLLDGHSSNI